MMMNKKVTLLTAGILGLGGLAAMNNDFAFAEETTEDQADEETTVFDWMQEHMGQGFQRFYRTDDSDGGLESGLGGPFNRSDGGFIGRGMHGGGPGHMFGNGPGVKAFQDDEWLEEREAFMQERFEAFDSDMTEAEREAWFEEHDEVRREHFESMHPQWNDEAFEEREALRQEMFESFDPEMTEEEQEALREEREALRNERRENNHHRSNRRPFGNSEE